MAATNPSLIECSVTPSNAGETVHLKVLGVLDENVDFSSVPFQGKVALDVDLGSVTRCNSMGIMRWARFLKSVPAEVQIRINDCSTILAKQLNIFPVFLAHPNLKVVAFQSNYHCRTCEATHRILLKTDDIRRTGGSWLVPPKLCPKCRQVLELDGIPQTLFMFIDRKPAPSDHE